jgi:hypothetical protein
MAGLNPLKISMSVSLPDLWVEFLLWLVVLWLWWAELLVALLLLLLLLFAWFV